MADVPERIWINANDTPDLVGHGGSGTYYTSEEPQPAVEYARVHGEEDAKWRPISEAPRDKTPVIVGLVKDGRTWRVSDALHNGLGWYSLHGGQSCHWATHYIPLPNGKEIK